MDDAKRIKSLPPLIDQTILRALGIYASTYLGNDIYYLLRAIYLLKSTLGEEYIEVRWNKKGYDWEKTKKNLEILDKKSIEVKAWYDALEDKQNKKKTSEIEVKRYFRKTASKIPALLPEIYDLFVFLVMETTLQRRTIPAEAFKVLEHLGRRTIDHSRKRPETQTQQTPESKESLQTSD